MMLYDLEKKSPNHFAVRQYRKYKLAADKIAKSTYRETEFYKFDQFLFDKWTRKPNGKSKNEIPWGVPGTE